MTEKMRGIWKSAAALILAALLLCGCGQKSDGVDTGHYVPADSTTGLSNGTVAENTRFALSWDAAFSQVIVTDKATGAQYSTMPRSATGPIYDDEGQEVFLSSHIQSPLIVYYYDATTLTERTLLSYDEAILAGGCYAEPIQNGLKVTYDFISRSISVPVEYKLYDDRFELSVDPKKITDDGTNYVTGFSLAPFLCGVENDAQDSYFFLPDGSGTLLEPAELDVVGYTGELPVYGADAATAVYLDTSYTKQTALPVFGVKRSDSALFGVITSGAEQASVCWDIGSETKLYSTVYPRFALRTADLLKRPAHFSSAQPRIQVYSETISPEPIAVSYYLLTGDDADYSGMATAYRNYLLETGALEKRETADITADIKLLGGVQQQTITLGIPHTVLAPVTTAKDAAEIAAWFSDAGMGEFMLRLAGFGQSGLDLGAVGGGFKFAGGLGSKKEFRTLAQQCKDSGILLFADYDIVQFSKNGGGYKLSRDGALQMDGQTLYLYGFDFYARSRTSEHYSLLSRTKLSKAAEKAARAAADYGFSGVGFSSLSQLIYSDSAEEGSEAAAGMAALVASVFGETGKTVSTFSENANAYAACASDYVTGVPLTSSDYRFTSVDIPFYQMVFHGYRVLSGAPLNLSADPQRTLLSCIETGTVPAWTLSALPEDKVLLTDYSALSSSRWTQLRDGVVEAVKLVSPVLERVSGSVITRHEIRPDGLRITVYENGVRVAVNPTDAPLTLDGQTVAAGGYLIAEG